MHSFKIRTWLCCEFFYFPLFLSAFSTEILFQGSSLQQINVDLFVGNANRSLWTELGYFMASWQSSSNFRRVPVNGGIQDGSIASISFQTSVSKDWFKWNIAWHILRKNRSGFLNLRWYYSLDEWTLSLDSRNWRRY